MFYKAINGMAGQYHSLTLGRRGPRMIVIGYAKLMGQNSLIPDFHHHLTERSFHWGRGVPSDLDIKMEKGWNAITGIKLLSKKGAAAARDFTEYAVILAYPSRMSLLESLDWIEQDEHLRVPASFFGAFLCANRVMSGLDDGSIPQIFADIPPRLACEILTGIHWYSPDFDESDPDPKIEIPPLRSTEEIRALARDVPAEMYRGKPEILLRPLEEGGQVMTGSRPPKQLGENFGCYNYEVVERLLPTARQMRALDIARWLVAYGDYLWSQEWWQSEKIMDFSAECDTVVATIIEQAAEIGQFFRKSRYEYKGQPIAVPFSEKWLENVKDFEDYRNVMDSTFRVWLQLVELYATNAPVEVIQALNPTGMYRHVYLGVDAIFNPDENLSQLKILASELQEKTRKERIYTPMGAFWYDLPQELSATIRNIELDSVLPMPVHLDVKTIHLYVDGLQAKMWVRLYGERGSGPIIGWQPGHKLHDNLLSLPFSVILDFLLSAIWRDLCCAGEKSFPKESDAVAPPQVAGADQISSGGGRKRHRSSRAESPVMRMLPTIPDRNDILPMHGRRSWSTAEERERIKMMIHQVKGYPRRLPEGQKRSAEKDQQIWELGIILPADRTYVSPFTRGSRRPNEPVERQGPQIISKGLATLITFFSTLRSVPTVEEGDESEPSSL